jgi:Flp pilus assembly protein TadD
MLRGKVVLALLALACAGSSMAQQNQQSNQSTHDMQMQQQAEAYSRSEASGNDWERGYDQRSVKAMSDLPKVRAHLTEVWQHFGMSPKDAAVVASAYRVSDNDNGFDKASSLIGKSDAEIASMLQSALSTKNYVLADLLMINYERKRIHTTAGN